jgi:uncharacterized protein (TIGR01777 family)
MRVIITGGTGLIGSALANSLAKDGHEVVVLSRSKHKTAGLAPGVRLVEWDARTADGWGDLADGAGAIVNLAGESIAGEGFPPKRWTPERRKLILESRVNAGRAVTEAVQNAATKPGVVIQQSAVGYYGPHGAEDVTEDTPPGDDFLVDVTRQWEASTQEVENMGVRRAVTRTGLVLSSQGGVLPLMAIPFKLFVGGKIGSGGQQIPWIHIDDQTRAYRFLIDNPAASGAFNLSAPQPLPNAAFSKALGRALGRPSYFPTPGFPFKLLFGELGDVLLLKGQRAVPKHLQDLGFQFHYPEAVGALKDLYQNKK